MRIIKTLYPGIVLLLLPLVALAGEDGVASNVIALPFALQTAMAGNPSLAQAGAKARALAEVPSQVGTLPDPVLSLGALSLPTDTFSTLRLVPMTLGRPSNGFKQSKEAGLTFPHQYLLPIPN